MPGLPVGQYRQGADGAARAAQGLGAIRSPELAAIQAELLKDSRWVGDEFADTARAMHSGEIEREQVHGNATLEQAKSLVDEGVPVAPLPLPVVPPSQVN